jgi:hypothetical protein
MDSDGGFLSIGCLECLGRKLCLVDFPAAATAVPQINRLSPRNTPRLRARKLAKLSCTCDNIAPFDEA